MNTIRLNFIKTTAGGNDFILIDNREKKYKLNWVQLAPTICNRRFGVGADGILVIETGAKALYRMLYCNADGSVSGMCGNGGRCLAAYLMEITGQPNITFEAFDYLYKASKTNSQIKLTMKPPNSIRDNVKIKINSGVLVGYYLDTGAPHAVFLIDQQTDKVKKRLSNSIFQIGKEIRYCDEFKPDGANVNFIRKISSKSISIRTYERGVEDETLACGTGACASAIVANIAWGLKPPIIVETRGGEPLTVNFENAGKSIINVSLSGTVTRVFEGTIVIDLNECRILKQ